MYGLLALLLWAHLFLLSLILDYFTVLWPAPLGLSLSLSWLLSIIRSQIIRSIIRSQITSSVCTPSLNSKKRFWLAQFGLIWIPCPISGSEGETKPCPANVTTRLGMHTGVHLPQKVSKMLAKTVVFVILATYLSYLVCQAENKTYTKQAFPAASLISFLSCYCNH